MRDHNRFIPGEEMRTFDPWRFGSVDTAAVLLAAQVKAREEASDQARNDALRQQGYAEGFAQGQAQATLEAQRQMADFVAKQGQEAALNFAQIFASVQAQLVESEQVIARGVLELACEIARQVVRRELSLDPEALKPVIREALGLLMAETKTALVRLNRVDLAALEAATRAEFAGMSLTFLADATLTRGSCLIESAGTVLDGTLEKRWMRAVASLGLSSSWEVSGDKH